MPGRGWNVYVLDSSVLIELIERKAHAHKVAAFIGNELSATTSICVHEVLAGARTNKQRFLCEEIFSNILILNHDMKAARMGAQIEQELNESGSKINIIDVYIASICRANNTEIVTLDKDFEKIKGINVHVIK